MASSFWSVAEAKAEKASKAGSEPLGYAIGVLDWMLTAGVYVAAKAVIHELPPWTLCFFRVAIAFAVLLPVVRHQLPEIVAFLKQRWLAVLITGGIGLAITQGFMYQALEYTTAISAGIIFATGPIITMILARIVLGERMTAGQGVGSAIAFLGVVVIAVQGSVAVLLGLDFGAGDILVVIAAFLFAVYTVLLKREKFELPRLPLLVTLLGAAVIVSFPFFLYELATGQHENLNTPGILALLYCAIPGGAIMYLLYNWSIEILGAGKGGQLMYLQMIFTTFLAWLLLGEQVQWYHFAGMALIVVGIVLVITMKARASVAAPAK